LQGDAAEFALEYIKAALRAALARLAPSTSGPGAAGGPSPRKGRRDNEAMTDWDQLGTDTATAVQVVVATIGIYLVLVVLLRIGGQRGLVAMSSVDVACVIAIGAVVGRTALLAEPTLVTGVIALSVLFGMQRLLTILGGGSRGGRILSRRPVVLMRDGLLCQDEMRRSRVSEDDLRQRLRLTGASRREQVQLVVLERSGEISVLRSNVKAEAWLVHDLDVSGSRTPRA
jgi:uncharacterized membrane protein YcaP (DUF421 family)